MHRFQRVIGLLIVAFMLLGNTSLGASAAQPLGTDVNDPPEESIVVDEGNLTGTDSEISGSESTLQSSDEPSLSTHPDQVSQEEGNQAEVDQLDPSLPDEKALMVPNEPSSPPIEEADENGASNEIKAPQLRPAAVESVPVIEVRSQSQNLVPDVVPIVPDPENAVVTINCEGFATVELHDEAIFDRADTLDFGFDVFYVEGIGVTHHQKVALVAGQMIYTSQLDLDQMSPYLGIGVGVAAYNGNAPQFPVGGARTPQCTPTTPTDPTDPGDDVPATGEVVITITNLVCLNGEATVEFTVNNSYSGDFVSGDVLWFYQVEYSDRDYTLGSEELDSLDKGLSSATSTIDASEVDSVKALVVLRMDNGSGPDGPNNGVDNFYGEFEIVPCTTDVEPEEPDDLAFKLKLSYVCTNAETATVTVDWEADSWFTLTVLADYSDDNSEAEPWLWSYKPVNVSGSHQFTDIDTSGLASLQAYANDGVDAVTIDVEPCDSKEPGTDVPPVDNPDNGVPPVDNPTDEAPVKPEKPGDDDVPVVENEQSIDGDVAPAPEAKATSAAKSTAQVSSSGATSVSSLPSAGVGQVSAQQTLWTSLLGTSLVLAVMAGGLRFIEHRR